MFVLLHDLGNPHTVRFHLLFIGFDFLVAGGDFLLEQRDLPQGALVFRRELHRGQPRQAGAVNAGQGLQSQLGLYVLHGGRLVVLQAPDPLLQALKNHVLFRLIPDDFRHGQICFRVVAPDTGESAVLHIQHCQVKPQLQFIIEGDGVLRPIPRLVVGAAFALQDARFSIFLAGIPPVDVGQGIGVIRMLVQVGVVCDQVSRLFLEPVGGDGLQQVAHLQLVLVAFDRGFHPPLLDEPQLQGCGPGGQAENGCHIAAPYGVGDISFRPVGPALQPAVVGHTGAVAEDDGRRHQYSTPFARS